jgi:hypothetical protein
VNKTAQRICVWTGPAATVIFIVGFILLAGFIPPPSPALDANQVVAIFTEHTTAIRIGMLVTQLSMALLLTWGIGVATQMRRCEGSRPVMANVQIASVAVATVIVVLMTVVWETAAFRPDVLPPPVIQAFNDLGWFILLFDWIPFAIWALAVAVPIFSDRGDPTIFPRWAGYVSVWTAVLFFPAGLMAFFKNGVFAWNGLLAFYIPVGVFFVWLICITVVTLRAITLDGADEVSVAADVPDDASALTTR